MLDPTIGTLIDLGAAALLASAAVHKIRDFESFAGVFAAYRIAPARGSRAFAALVPAMELAAALALPWPSTHRIAGFGAAGLIALYGAAIAWNLARGRRDLDCGCGGPRDRRRIAGWMVWRNALIAALLVAAAVVPWSARALAGVDGLTLGGGLFAMAVLYRALDRLMGEIAPKGFAMRGAR
ncbi:MAG: methylamine utilization protein MauE [Gammaproteobacteria bacterium]|nr:methylamine utilization protein MauE [Gammaproteobacteria bacterium]